MRTRWIVALIAIVGIAGVTGAYLGRRPDASSSEEQRAPAALPRAATPTPTPAPEHTTTKSRRRPERSSAPAADSWIDRAALNRDVRRIAHRGQVGVAVRPLDGGAVVQAGTARTGKAWSTMKVPVVLARLRLENGGTADRSRAALTASDNAAAQSLFDDIADEAGGVESASRFVQESLREAGDAQTVVNTDVPAGGFSTFGQTEWSLAAGTHFFSALARGCLEPRGRDEEITALMGDVVADQRWGLGSAGLNGVAFKGGWGPESDGRYLVRQFGIVRAKGRRGLVIGLLARPDDGAFETGATMLTELARATAARVKLMATPAASPCPS